MAISAANLECAEWDGREPSFVIASTNLIMRRGAFHADCVVTCVVSLHAAARRLQRGISTPSDDDLLDDAALLAQHDATELIPEGTELRGAHRLRFMARPLHPTARWRPPRTQRAAVP